MLSFGCRGIRVSRTSETWSTVVVGRIDTIVMLLLEDSASRLSQRRVRAVFGVWRWQWGIGEVRSPSWGLAP